MGMVGLVNADRDRPKSDVLGQLAPLVRERGIRATARASGVSHPTISRFLSGQSSISVAVLEEIADALNLQISITPRQGNSSRR